MAGGAGIWTCGILALCALVWSVFAFGSAADGFRTVAVVVTAIAGVGCLGLLPRKGWRLRASWMCWSGWLCLLGFGWFMVWNASADHSLLTWQFTAVDSRIWEDGPGSVARSASLRSLLELSAVMIAFLAVLRSAESGAWLGFVKMVALLGAAVALVGFLHKATDAKTVWWIEDRIVTSTHFAPFVYNANAGAYMNLCLPLAHGLALGSIGDAGQESKGVFWGIVAVVIMAGVLATASKGAILVMFLIVPMMVLWNWRRVKEWMMGMIWRKRGRMERAFLTLGVVVLGLVLVGIGIGLTVKRWDAFLSTVGDGENVSVNGRLGMMKLMVRMSGPDEGGWHGFGPGTFRHLVPHFTVGEAGEDVAKGRWLLGHSDPLQTLVEWGYLGAVGWALIAGGALWSGLTLLRRRSLIGPNIPVLRGIMVGLIGIGVHSCFDFPLSIYSLHLVAMALCAVLLGLYAEQGRERR